MITRREIEVLRLAGKLNQQGIAKKLKISQPAVSKLYNNALRKIKEAKEVIKLAKELGIK